MKIGTIVVVDDEIILSKFGFRSTGGHIFRLFIDFAGHSNNSAAATAQPVMRLGYLSVVAYVWTVE